MSGDERVPEAYESLVERAERSYKESISNTSLDVLILGSYASEPKDILEGLKNRISNWTPVKHNPFFMEDLPSPGVGRGGLSERLLKFGTCTKLADVIVVVYVPQTIPVVDPGDIMRRGEYLEGMFCVLKRELREKTCFFFKNRGDLTSMIDLLNLPCPAYEEFSSVDDIVDELQRVFPRFQNMKFAEQFV